MSKGGALWIDWGEATRRVQSGNHHDGASKRSGCSAELSRCEQHPSTDGAMYVRTYKQTAGGRRVRTQHRFHRILSYPKGAAGGFCRLAVTYRALLSEENEWWDYHAPILMYHFTPQLRRPFEPAACKRRKRTRTDALLTDNLWTALQLAVEEAAHNSIRALL